MGIRQAINDNLGISYFSSCGKDLVALWHVQCSLTGTECMSPALAGGFLTTGPPGKSKSYLFFNLTFTLGIQPYPPDSIHTWRKNYFQIF